jgi:hypothetical protein
MSVTYIYEKSDILRYLAEETNPPVRTQKIKN